MEEKETKKTEKEIEVGLVSFTGEIGYGMKMPDGETIELKNTDIGTAQLLAYLVKTVHEIRKQI